LFRSIKGLAVCSACDHYRQAEKLQRGEGRSTTQCRTPPQKYQNNRAENSHQSTRLRERVMRRFKSTAHAQRFLSAFGIIASHFRPGRHLSTAAVYRQMMKRRLAVWEDV